VRDLKDSAKQIYLRTLDSLELDTVIKNKIAVVDETMFVDGEPVPLSSFSEIVLVGIGKASIKMGAVIEAILKDYPKRGLLVTSHCSTTEVSSQVLVAGHPLPNENSLKAGAEILDLIGNCEKDSLILFLISGGGSSLVEAPILNEVTLEQLKDLNRVLVYSGATIAEINVVRKHLSRIKGGRLGYLARGCSYVALYVSDVNKGDLRSIASNPLLPDEATLEEFFGIIEKYGLLTNLPDPIKKAIIDKRILSLPKSWSVEGQKALCLLLENEDALRVASRIAKEEGYEVEIEPSLREGGYRDVADKLIARMLKLREANPGRPFCLISGGEVSCPVQGNGLGGRNQEFVLYSAEQLAILGFEDAAVLSCGTDGIDGNSFATGAVADRQMIKAAERLGLVVSQFLLKSDSHSFFQEMGGMIVTGPTGNNVRDLRVMLVK
jgi:glycerate 2-kinase